MIIIERGSIAEAMEFYYAHNEHDILWAITKLDIISRDENGVFSLSDRLGLHLYQDNRLNKPINDLVVAPGSLLIRCSHSIKKSILQVLNLKWEGNNITNEHDYKVAWSSNDLIGFNCVEFINQIAEIAGVSVIRYTVPELITIITRILYDSEA